MRNKCDTYVLDKTNKRYRKCKNNICFDNICFDNICYIHYSIKYKNIAILIQSIFRGNKIRNKIKNIYNLLPYDIQRKIIFHVRIDHNYYKYKKVINNIINKKVFTLPLIIGNILNNDNYLINITTITHIFFLINKYFNIYQSIDSITFMLNLVIKALNEIYTINIYSDSYHNLDGLMEEINTILNIK